MASKEQSSILNGVVGLLRISGIARVATMLSGSSLSIVMMHRFSAPSEGRAYHDPSRLRADLALLRKAGVDLLDLDDALERLTQRYSARSGKSGAGKAVSKEAGRPAVVFTIDDGYSDAIDVAAPVFAEFDCPVTCFVAPHIVEGREWYWWDKLDHILKHSKTETLGIHLANGNLEYSIGSLGEKRVAYDAICSLIKRLPSSQVSPLLAQLASRASVTIPASAPSEYQTLTWDEIRKAESSGWRFGAHSMTHPVLSRCEEKQSAWEISESIAVLRRETRNSSNVFCYPVGQVADFGEREWKEVERCGFKFALSAVPGGLRYGATILSDPAWQYKIPRFSHDDRPGGIIRMLLG